MKDQSPFLIHVLWKQCISIISTWGCAVSHAVVVSILWLTVALTGAFHGRVYRLYSLQGQYFGNCFVPLLPVVTSLLPLGLVLPQSPLNFRSLTDFLFRWRLTCPNTPSMVALRKAPSTSCTQSSSMVGAVRVATTPPASETLTTWGTGRIL